MIKTQIKHIPGGWSFGLILWFGEVCQGQGHEGLWEVSYDNQALQVSHEPIYKIVS